MVEVFLYLSQDVSDVTNNTIIFKGTVSMNTTLLKPVAGIVLALTVGLAQATTLDFTVPKVATTKDLTEGSAATGLYDVSSSLGFLLTKSTLVESLGGSVKVSEIGPDKYFDLNSIDLSAFVLSLKAPTVTLSYEQLVNGHLDAGSEVFKLSDLSGLKTIDLGLDDLTSFTLKGGTIGTTFTLSTTSTSPRCRNPARWPCWPPAWACWASWPAAARPDGLGAAPGNESRLRAAFSWAQSNRSDTPVTNSVSFLPSPSPGRLS